MESSLLSYDIYTKTLKYHEFAFNAYHICIVNIIVDYKHYIIACYIYKNKVLHINEDVNTKIFETIFEHFSEHAAIRGGGSNYWEKTWILGNGKVWLFMIYYID